MYVPILVYHKISRALDLSVTRVPPRRFNRQIRHLRKQGYHALTVSEFVRQSSPSTRHKKYVLVTFDDACASVYHEALPILSQFGFTATLFVITDYIGRNSGWDYPLSARGGHCDWEQLQTLATHGWEIGSHTRSHRSLRHLSPAHVRSELCDSRRLLEDRLGRPVRVVAFPFGQYDQGVLDCAWEAGYHAACTLSGPHIANAHRSLRLLARRGVYWFDPLFFFKLKLTAHPFEDYKQRTISFCANGTILLQRLRELKINA